MVSFSLVETSTTKTVQAQQPPESWDGNGGTVDQDVPCDQQPATGD
jgi:hypothetical protein